MGHQADLRNIYLQERLSRLRKRPRYLVPNVDWAYAPGGASDIEALREIRKLVSLARHYDTSAAYRNAEKLLDKFSNYENLSQYVREVAKSCLDYMNDYEGLGWIDKFTWKNIQPQNAATLVIKPWQAIGDVSIVLQYDMGVKLLKDRWSIDLPPDVVFTQDGDLITKRAYYERYKYAVLHAPLEEIKRYSLGEQLGKAFTQIHNMSPDELVKIREPEKIAGW